MHCMLADCLDHTLPGVPVHPGRSPGQRPERWTQCSVHPLLCMCWPAG